MMLRSYIGRFCVGIVALMIAAEAAVASMPGVYDVRDYGAAGDGATAAIAADRYLRGLS